MDASRQNRQPDPNIVPIQPRRKVDSDAQEDTAGVEAKPPADATRGEYVKGKSEDAAEALSTTEESHLNSNSDVLLGPSMSMHVDGSQPEANSMAPQKLEASTKFVLADFGGAWGAGAAPGSVLAKLMEEQEKLQQPHQQQQHQPRDGGVVHAAPSTTRRDSLGGATTTSSYGGSHADAGERHNRFPDEAHEPNYNNSGYGVPPPPPPPPPPPSDEGGVFRGGRGWRPSTQTHQQQFQQDSYYPPQQQHQQYAGGRGRGGFRGGGRGGGNRGYQGPPSTGGGFDPRKRPRDDPRWSR